MSNVTHTHTHTYNLICLCFVVFVLYKVTLNDILLLPERSDTPLIPVIAILYSITVCRLRADRSPLSTGILYGHLQRATIPEAVIIQFVLLKISKLLLETC